MASLILLRNFRCYSLFLALWSITPPMYVCSGMKLQQLDQYHIFWYHLVTLVVSSSLVIDVASSCWATTAASGSPIAKLPDTRFLHTATLKFMSSFGRPSRIFRITSRVFWLKTWLTDVVFLIALGILSKSYIHALLDPTCETVHNTHFHRVCVLPVVCCTGLHVWSTSLCLN